MKNIFLLVFIILFCCACNKEELEPKIDWSVYQSEAVLNDSLRWYADVSWTSKLNSGKRIIQFDVFNEYRELREKIRIRDFNLKVGDIPLSYGWRGSDPKEPSAYFDTFIADGDASTEFYDLFDKEGFDNYVKINHISADSLEIEGEYQLFFVISEDSPSKFDKTRPDTLAFTNGVFKARYID